MSPELPNVVSGILQRAERQGHVVAREVREELVRGGLNESLWKQVVDLAGASLVFRRGRYYFQSSAAVLLQQEKQKQKSVRKAVRLLIRRHRQAARNVERRSQDRLDFVQPVKVTTEDNRTFQLLSRDLSPTGIRLIGTKRLLGQKVRLEVTQAETAIGSSFLVRILWTCAVGDDLFENGGVFLEVIASEGDR